MSSLHRAAFSTELTLHTTKECFAREGNIQRKARRWQMVRWLAPFSLNAAYGNETPIPE